MSPELGCRTMATEEHEADGSFELQHQPHTRQSDRQLVESLIACDEDQRLDLLVGTIRLETPDSVTAWQRTRPNVKYAWPKKRRSQQPQDVQAQDDIGISYHGNHHGYVRDRSKNGTGCTCAGLGAGSNVKGRNGRPASTEEFIPAWKMGVEPRTYRYVPDNGRYRASKIGSRSAGMAVVRHDHKTYQKLSWQQKQLQKEIQRELRKEFEKFTEYEKLRREGALQDAAEMNAMSSPGTQHPPVADEAHSGASAEDSCNCKRPEEEEAAMATRSPSPVELPPIAVPLVSTSCNEDFMENFHSRISALDAEIRRDQRIFYRSYEDVTRSVENERLTTSHWTKGRNNSGALKARALLEKASVRTDLDKKESCMRRIRRAASESHAMRMASEHLSPYPHGGLADGESTDELQLNVSGLNLHVTDEEQPIAVPASKEQPPILHEMTTKKEILADDTLHVRKLRTKDTDTSEVRAPLKYTHCDSTCDVNAATVDMRDREPAALCSRPSADYRSVATVSTKNSSGDIFRITKYGGESTSVPSAPVTADQYSNLREEAPPRNKRNPGILAKASEVPSTKESLRKLISASRLYTTASTGSTYVRNGFSTDNKAAGKAEGIAFGDAFHPSPVGKARPRREAKRTGGVIAEGIQLPEVLGKRLGQARLQAASGQRLLLIFKCVYVS